MLFFPPTGVDPVGLIERALDDPQIPQGKIELARLGPEDQPLISRLRANGSSNTHTESVLDWTYPVHIVSPTTIIDGAKPGSGKTFASFRGHINSAHQNGYKAASIDISQHEAHLISVIEQWAENKKSDMYSFDDLTNPTMAVIDLMKHNKSIDINGTISWDKEGHPIGLWLWQQTDHNAMSLVRAYILERRGNAEFGILNMSEQLHDVGISEMCLGGSETENLNTFKNKMRPIRSIELTTMSLPKPILSPVNENNHKAKRQYHRLNEGFAFGPARPR